ncbi:hypothetical protein D8S78_05460 [Natrialba swarupiae]|nr:hypothetical protein [Natrialba swarupiae]
MYFGATTKLGLVFLVVGALVLAGPVYGFSSIAADRGVHLSTAADENAALGVSSSDGSIDGDSDEAEIVTLQNNPLRHTYTRDHCRRSRQRSDGRDTVLDRNRGSEPIVVSCSGPGNPQNEIVSIDVTIEQAVADKTTIADVHTSSTVTYNCNPDGGGPLETVADHLETVADHLETVEGRPETVKGRPETVKGRPR